MKWERLTQWAEVSDCGRYTVAIASSGGFFTYQAWRRAKVKDHAGELLGTYTELQPARDRCAEHADQEAQSVDEQG